MTYLNGNVVGATNLANYLIGIYGNPQQWNGTLVDVRSLVEGKTGIIYFSNFIEEGRRSTGNNHIDLWNKTKYYGTNGFSSNYQTFSFSQMFQATIIWFFEIK